MKDQPNRLAAGTRHFAGAAILRSRPLKFKLNGLTISGFEGDTVLSAVLASGYDAVGSRDGWPMALTCRHAPPIFPVMPNRKPIHALPMERAPATPGAQYTTAGVNGLGRMSAAVSRLRGSRSLGLDLDFPATMSRPWLAAPAETGPEADMVVVGAGVAGMTAALAGAKAKQRVVLVESSLHMGGHARLFGSQEGEESPDQSVTRLVAAIAQDHTITVMLGAEAIAARPGAVRVHSVSLVRGEPVARTLDIHAPRIIIATGDVERLPIFSGNRLPGIATTLEAYSMAHQFGVWPGKTALFATVTNAAYRLAMLASDAGISVSRIIDGRVDPQSRFIEFAKAYGITMAGGTLPGEAKLAAKERQISLVPQSSLHRLPQAEPPLLAERVVMAGGWQPELTLWHMAGGESRWNAQRNRLEPILDGPLGMALAGSAAGFISGHACLKSGKAAVAQVLGRRPITVEERLIDPIYETPDAPTPATSSNGDVAPPAFLDAGQSYTERPEQKRSRWPGWVPFVGRGPAWSLADTPQPLAIADIAAGAQLGAIPPDSAGIVAQERVALIAIHTGLTAPPEPEPPRPDNAVPPYLAGRFGNSIRYSLAPLEKRRLEVGALIYADADEKNPFRAIGVVIRVVDNQATALMNADAANAKSAFVREDNRAIAVRVSAPQSAQADLSPPLGSATGTP
jgi:sarcosine oxidase subunit alpha